MKSFPHYALIALTATSIAAQPTASSASLSTKTVTLAHAKRQGFEDPPPKETIPNTVGTAQQYVEYIKAIYGLAIEWGQDEGLDPNRLVANYLRHKEYDSVGFNYLSGFIDHGFIERVNNAGVTFLQFIKDPKSGLEIKPSHFAACLDGIFQQGDPQAPDSNGADIAGWGGDLLTFYANDWRFAVQGNKALNKRASSPSASSFIKSSAMNKVEGSFKLRDLIEDADCYNVYQGIIADPSKRNVATEIESIFLRGGANDRIKRFYSKKFGSRAVAADTARGVLLQYPGRTDERLILNRGKASVLQTTRAGKGVLLPDNLDSAELNEFVTAWAQKLNDIAASAAQAI